MPNMPRHASSTPTHRRKPADVAPIGVAALASSSALTANEQMMPSVIANW